MNLFTDLRKNHGQYAVKLVRSLESTEQKIARHRNHLVFTLRCRDESVTPNSLKLRCPIRTHKARDIIAKAEKALVRERIRTINNKLKDFREKADTLTDELENTVPADTKSHIISHVTRARDRTYEQTKSQHVRKLEAILSKRKSAKKEDVDLSGTQLKKWVVNVSKYDLKDAESKVLSRGLNFAVAPEKVPKEEYVVATEEACKLLPPAEAEQLRAQIAGTLKQAKPPKPNISKEQGLALKTLSKQEFIIILPADKGKATVVMDKEDYESKVENMLKDEKVYEVLKKDPTAKYKKKLISILSRLRTEEKITESQCRWLYPTTENIPRMYCTPKIHKEGTPVRPIVDYTGSIGYNTSRALADILGPMLGHTDHHVKNSQHLAEDMNAVFIETGEMFISHDVVSLFTNTPIDQTLNIIRERLKNDRDLKNRTNLTVEDIMQLLEFIVTTTYFMFRGTIYQQKFGTAMGSPVSPVIANMYMEWLEHQAIATAPIECKPRLWKRYVDDVLEVIRKGTVCQLTDHLNTVDTTGSIKFTYEEEAEGRIPFLDTLIVRKEDGSVKLLVYRKKTHTDQYLDFSSHHPLHQKLGVIRTLLDRCNSLVTEDKDREREEQHITKALQQCRYPTWAITQVKKDMQQKRKAEQKKEKQRITTKEKSKGLVVIPYVKGLSETFTRIMREHGISTAIRPHRTLRNILVHPKDKVTDDKKSDVVYKIPCKNCEASYIGETGRTLGTRIKEHRNETC